MNLRRVSTRMIYRELGERLDFGADCDTNYEQPALHGLIDDLPETWTSQRRAQWLAAITQVVDTKVTVKESAPVLDAAKGEK